MKTGNLSTEPVSTEPVSTEPVPHERWYKYGVAVLFIEMAIAIAVGVYSFSMTFHGMGAFPGKH